MTRLLVMLLRGGFRLVLGVGVAVSIAWALLWLMEAVLGTAFWVFDNIWLGVALQLALALAGGIAVAIASDRAWIRVRGLGPELSVRRRGTRRS